MNEENISIKLAAIAKNEGAYIASWVFHHFYFGFDAIEIWINGSTDNSLVICEKIKAANPTNFEYKVVDDLLDKCKAENIDFQSEAYKLIYRDTKNSCYSHIIFLDLDEFWVSRNFTSTIKDLLKKIKDVDAISFQWYLDFPSTLNEEFSLFVDNLFVEKHTHVKTLIKITNKPIGIGVHNSVIHEGSFVMSDGTVFIEDDEKKQHNKSLVTKEYFERTKISLDEFYIHHAVYRSPKEYIAKLLIKNFSKAKNNKLETFKTNRWGYVALQMGPKLMVRYENHSVSKYKKNYIKYVNELKLIKDISEAKSFVNDQFETVISYLRKDAVILEKYKFLFFGIDLSKHLMGNYNGYGIKYNIDTVEINNNKLSINGWVLDMNSSTPPVITVNLNTVNEVYVEIFTKIRTDVENLYKNTYSAYGFQINITPEDLEKLSDVEPVIDLHFSNKFGSAVKKLKIDKINFPI